MLNSESLNKFERSLVTKSVAEENSIPAAITDVGCERDLNEDRYSVIESSSGLLWLVCDGMGGVKGGELAAQLVIDTIRRNLDSNIYEDVATAIGESILESNRVIVLRRQNPMFSQMGTTIVGAMFNGREVAITHVGDSRAYLVRGDSIQQLTEDHTYVQHLVNNQQIKLEDAMSHPQAHVLTKAIGSESGLKLDTKKYWIWNVENKAEQDFLVLVTDGLYSLVDDNEIAKYVNEYTPQDASSKLVELSKKRGGYDNITIAIIPLTGQLKSTPPANYLPAKPKIKVKKQKQSIKDLLPYIAKNFFIVFGLTLICLVLVVVVILFSLSK